MQADSFAVVWVQVKRGSNNIGRPTQIRVKSGDNVDALCDAVLKKLQDSLSRVDAIFINVSRSADPADMTAQLSPNAQVPADISYESPLYIHTPQKDQHNAEVPASYSHPPVKFGNHSPLHMDVWFTF